MEFGVKQLGEKTPVWAIWTFRIVFLLTGTLTFIIAMEPAIADLTKIRIGVYLKGLDMFVFGMSKMFGVALKKNTHETEN